ncbi:MAG TPA: histidine kinase [Gaiellaceae bacterium]|nr:histidine kinase [Gaiellaceae bacterium]
MRDELVSFIRRRGDEALAVALTVAVLAEILLRGGSMGNRLAGAALAVALGLAAARRVRAPLLLLGLMLAVSVAVALSKDLDNEWFVPFIVLLLAVYSAAAHTKGRQTLIAGGMTCALYVTDTVLIDPAGVTAETVVFYALLFGAPWVAGRAVRRRRLSEGLLKQEQAKAEAAIAEERARIARELHDVVAHSISIMVLQARGGRRALQTEPGDADEAFAIIERTGRQALEEMRRLLGMLRRSDEAIALAPQPSLKELDGLVEQMHAAGLPVQVAVEGEARELPPGVDLSAYRIVQEALTNALKHAGPARVRVLLRYGEDDLELEIADDGSGTGDGSGSGYGLLGMRERVSVYGGELQAGRRPEGGYALRVRLPLGSART